MGGGAAFARLAVLVAWILNVLALPTEEFVDDVAHEGTQLEVFVGVRAFTISGDILNFRIKWVKHIPFCLVLLYMGI